MLTAAGGAWLARFQRTVDVGRHVGRSAVGQFLAAAPRPGPAWAIERRLSQWVTAGDRLMVELIVTNRRRWVSGLALEIEDVCRYEGPARPASQCTGAGGAFRIWRRGRRAGWPTKAARRFAAAIGLARCGFDRCAVGAGATSAD